MFFSGGGIKIAQNYEQIESYDFERTQISKP